MRIILVVFHPSLDLLLSVRDGIGKISKVRQFAFEPVVYNMAPDKFFCGYFVFHIKNNKGRRVVIPASPRSLL